MRGTPLSIAIVGAGVGRVDGRIHAAAMRLRRAGVRAGQRGNDHTSWLFGYDAWNVPLNEPALNPAS